MRSHRPSSKSQHRPASRIAAQSVSLTTSTRSLQHTTPASQHDLSHSPGSVLQHSPASTMGSQTTSGRLCGLVLQTEVGGDVGDAVPLIHSAFASQQARSHAPALISQHSSRATTSAQILGGKSCGRPTHADVGDKVGDAVGQKSTVNPFSQHVTSHFPRWASQHVSVATNTAHSASLSSWVKPLHTAGAFVGALVGCADGNDVVGDTVGDTVG